jgi:hypothetical protein
MPVFESNSSDIYERDANEDPFHLRAFANRHSTINASIDRNPLVTYLMLLLQSEDLLAQYRTLRLLQETLREWVQNGNTRAAPPPPAPPPPVAPSDESDVNEPFDPEVPESDEPDEGDDNLYSDSSSEDRTPKSLQFAEEEETELDEVD